MTAATNRSRRARFRREVVLAVGARPTRRRAFRGTFGGRAVAPARLIHSSPHLHAHTPTPARRAREGIANERKLSRGNTAPGSPDPASRARTVRRQPDRAVAGSRERPRRGRGTVDRGRRADQPPGQRARAAAAARASRSLPLSPSPAPSRERERAPPTLEGRARFGSRDPLGERAAPRRESERENLPPPRASRPLSLLTMSRARASRVQYGRTPLWRAAGNGHLDMVRALLNAGADKTIANNSGYKPIDVVCTWEAANKQHKDAIVALLR